MGDASYTRREKANFSGAAAADSLHISQREYVIQEWVTFPSSSS
jgi:hypothetical protein